jgi:CTP:molybdopterin cytidylyltransferase MocA
VVEDEPDADADEVMAIIEVSRAALTVATRHHGDERGGNPPLVTKATLVTVATGVGARKGVLFWVDQVLQAGLRSA